MPNGYTINNRLDFEEAITKMKSRELQEFVARLVYDHCEEQKDFGDRISKNTKLAWQNRYIVMGLIILLIALGVLDASVAGVIF